MNFSRYVLNPLADRRCSPLFSASGLTGVTAAVPEPHDLEQGIFKDKAELFPDRHGGLHVVDYRVEVRLFRRAHGCL